MLLSASDLLLVAARTGNGTTLFAVALPGRASAGLADLVQEGDRKAALALVTDLISIAGATNLSGRTNAEIADRFLEQSTMAGGALPHQATIQAAFGRHDVGGIGAHVGGDAATASRKTSSQS